MSKNGKVTIDDLTKFRDVLEQNLNEQQIDEFIQMCSKELAARLLAKVIKRTPVGQYSKSSGKKGGTLRRGWTNGKAQAAHQYAQNLKVHSYGGVYVIEIINPVEYAEYVEFGHRTRNHEGWVEGQFFLTISEQEIEKDAPRVLTNKLNKFLKECFT